METFNPYANKGSGEGTGYVFIKTSADGSFLMDSCAVVNSKYFCFFFLLNFSFNVIVFS